MPSSIIEGVVAVPVKAQRAGVKLIAWDPESEVHAERMYRQRVACGWKGEYVEQWRDLQREGKMALQWVVLSEEDPEKETKLAQHLLKYPGEAAPILDTATTLGGKPRTPSLRSFIPVGHISLDAESPNPDQADASRGIYCITTFYISRAIQGGGLGRAAMDAIESEAVNEPLCAKILSLDTFANANTIRSNMWVEIGMQPPLVPLKKKNHTPSPTIRGIEKLILFIYLSNEDWYGRRGYKVWKYVEGHIQHPDQNGKVWPLDAVFMKKTVA